ncbi:YkgJ family cysteine cluster protein [Cohnella pontilimi]|uniref:YkgJ family cysteine cluster protein n=1 Tax=Cohnella pontilimi TaxID=2564100 RepID=UPI00319DA7B8
MPCKGCRGLCCGPVPVTETELRSIKKYVKSMSSIRRSQLQNQERFYGTCIFYEQDHDRCGIHSARPSICRAFGLYQNLVCFRKPEAAGMENFHAKERSAGILSVDYTWRDF